MSPMNEKVYLSLLVEKEVKERLDKVAKSYGVSRSDLVRLAIRRELELPRKEVVQ